MVRMRFPSAPGRRGIPRPTSSAATVARLLAIGLAFQSLGLVGTAWATHSPTHFVVRREGTSYVAQSQTKTYTGALKTVVESALNSDLKPAGGGTITFQAGVFDLGSSYFRFEEFSDVVIEGQGIDVTTIQNSSNASDDTEPFNTKGASRVTIRDLTVVAGGTPRTTSDAIDLDKGNNILIERVKITASRGKGIIFDGKDAGWTSQGNTVRDCEISGTNNDGIQFLASSNNRVEGCFIHDTVRDGIEATKAQTIHAQPNKKSTDNVIIGNVIDNAGENGIRIHSSDRNLITGNTVTNSSDDVANRDGIQITSGDSITCDDNRVEGNTATDNQATKTQRYGLNINHSLCNRTFVGTNNFAGNLVGAIRDVGTNTQYGTSDATPPSTPTNLQATAASSSRVDLSWTASTDNVGVSAYDIYRNSSLLTSVGAVTSHSDTTVSPSTTYSYQVRARDSAGNLSGLSNTASVTTPPGPPPPSVLTFTPTDDASVRADQPGNNFGALGSIGVDSSPVKHYLMKFNVTGIDSSDSGGVFYRVMDPNSWSEGAVTWNTSPAADTNQVASLGGVSATKAYEVDLTSIVTGDGLVSVKVVSNSASGNGADFYSKEGSVPPQLVVSTMGDGSPDTTPPTDPTNLQATAVSSSRIDLSWTASTDNVGVTGYDIFRNGSPLTSVGAVSSYSDTTASPSTSYSYQVRAKDAASNVSGFSNTATATTPAASAALFSDGFETGNFANWTSNSGLVAQQQQVYQGAWAARGTTTSAATWAYKTLGSTHTELHYRIRFKVVSQGASSTVNLLKLRTATGTALFGLL